MYMFYTFYTQVCFLYKLFFSTFNTWSNTLINTIHLWGENVWFNNMQNINKLQLKFRYQSLFSNVVRKYVSLYFSTFLVLVSIYIWFITNDRVLKMLILQYVY